MAVCLPVPQEIVYEIVDKLEDSPDTLKACARVARSFLIPSRKKMFSSIQLTTENAQRLLPILQRNPDISIYISDVTIVSLSSHNTILLDILASLKCLRQLTIQLGTSKSLPSYEPIIGDLLLSPKYAALDIHGSIVLPCTVINRLKMRKLRLYGVMVQNSTIIEDTGELESTLETLDLLVWSVPDQRLEPLHLFRNVFGLRELSLRMKWGHEKTLSLGRDIIARSASSIEHVALYYDNGAYITPDLSLERVDNLRILSFSLQYLFSEKEEPDKFKFDWDSILDILSDSFTIRNLQELSLAIEFRPVGISPSVIGGLYAWSDMDRVLGRSASKLRKINLYVDEGAIGCPSRDGWLQLTFDNQFSCLRERGVTISYSSYNPSTLDFRRW